MVSKWFQNDELNTPFKRCRTNSLASTTRCGGPQKRTFARGDGAAAVLRGSGLQQHTPEQTRGEGSREVDLNDLDEAEVHHVLQQVWTDIRVL